MWKHIIAYISHKTRNPFYFLDALIFFSFFPTEFIWFLIHVVGDHSLTYLFIQQSTANNVLGTVLEVGDEASEQVRQCTWFDVAYILVQGETISKQTNNILF